MKTLGQNSTASRSATALEKATEVTANQYSDFPVY